MRKFTLLVLAGIGSLLLIVCTPIIKAQNIQADDLSLSTYAQSVNVGDFVEVNVESTNEEDIKVFIPLSANVQYQGGNGGSGSVQYDEVNHQIIVDWPSKGTKNTNFDLLVSSEGDFSTKAYSIRQDSAVESAQLYIQTNSNETEEMFEESAENEVLDSSVTDESQTTEPSTENESSSEEEAVENIIDETIDTEESEVGNVEEEFSSLVTGNWGNVPWEWDESTATITLQGGNAGTVDTAPWKVYNNVEKIIVQEIVSLPRTSSSLFSRLRNLREIENSTNFDTSSVTTMFQMFYQCTSLIEIDISNWDTSMIGNFNQVFNGATSLQKLICPMSILILILRVLLLQSGAPFLELIS